MGPWQAAQRVVSSRVRPRLHSLTPGKSVSRKRSRPLFELGGQWIAREPGRASLYRFWTDRGTNRSRRASLGTDDLERAKIRLAEIVLSHGQAAPSAPLAIVLKSYFEAHTDRLPSAQAARAAGKLMLAFWGETAKLSDLTEDAQKRFAAWSVGRGHSLAYVARNLGVLAAAAAHAKVRLSVVSSEAAIRDRWRLADAKPARRAYVPTDAELAHLLRTKMPEDLRRWLLISMATGCRPAAAVELSPGQRQRAARLIDLNPHGRSQTKKHRPVVREPRALTRALDRWEAEDLDLHGGRYCGYASVASVQTAIDRIRDAAGMPRLTAYSVRHKVVTVLRAAGVPADQIALQVGHRRPDTRITGSYGEWSPDYLREAADALDAWLRKVQKLAANPHTIPTKRHSGKRRAA